MNTSLISGAYFKGKDHLDLSDFLNLLSSYFHFTQNKNEIRSSPQRRSLPSIELSYLHQTQVSSILNWEQLSYEQLIKVHGDFSFQNALTKLKRYQTLEENEILNIYSALMSYPKLTKVFQLKGHTSHPPQEIHSTFKKVKKDISLLFDEKERKIVYNKHPLLSPLDKRIQEITKLIREKITQIMSQWSKEELLQNHGHDMINERYLLPVRSDRYSARLGKIIYHSNSGNTLFVEPTPLRDLTNEKSEYEIKLERELHKLLHAISNHFSQERKLIKEIFHFYIDLDRTAGSLKAGEELGLTPPEFSYQKKILELKDLFHPLIKNPIKNNFSLSQNSLGLLISGPNTGGKTVLLKSLALVLLMPHLGLNIPAKQGILPLCENIYFLSHDNQDLKEGLSSFSSEAIVYLEILKKIKKGDAIFIDEIFNSTSSQEASELALAIIKELKKRGVLIFISSHHESLKKRVYEESLLESAHMGFQSEKNIPTYILHQGTPGKSYAKEVFKTLEQKILGNLSITKNITTEISSQTLDRKISALEKIEEEKRMTYEETLKLKDEILREKEGIQGLLSLEKNRLQKEFEEKWQALKEKAFKEINSQKSLSKASSHRLAHKLSKLNPPNYEKENEIDSKLIPVKDLNIGDIVYLKGLNKKGSVIGLSHNGKRAQINCNGLKIWQSRQQLSYEKDSPSKGSKIKEKKEVSVSILNNQSERSFTFDARGMRREEFLQKVEFYIHDVLNGNLPFVDIIHGHGDGILKNALYEILNHFKDDISHGPIEGNLGCTRVELLN